MKKLCMGFLCILLLAVCSLLLWKAGIHTFMQASAAQAENEEILPVDTTSPAGSEDDTQTPPSEQEEQDPPELPTEPETLPEQSPEQLPAEPETSPEPLPPVQPEKPDQEDPAEEGEKAPDSSRLDFAALDKLDNTRYSWWIKQNNDHKIPGVPAGSAEMLEKHNGIYIGDTTAKKIYLTFDEGYENGYTAKILDVLKENDVKSLFFVTAPYIRKNGELVQRMLDEGHQVGNHSVTHPSLPQVDNRQLEAELYGLEDEYYKRFGQHFRYMRPPKGEYSPRVLEAARQMGYKTVFWSFAYRDFEVDKQKGAAYAYEKVMTNLHNGAVLLLHAVSKDNAEALDSIIKGIRAQGYEISPFDL